MTFEDIVGLLHDIVEDLGWHIYVGREGEDVCGFILGPIDFIAQHVGSEEFETWAPPPEAPKPTTH